jgi:DNA-binding response OmpR family regulator
MKVSNAVWILEDDESMQYAYQQAFTGRAGGLRFFSSLKEFFGALISGAELEVPVAAILDLRLSDGNLLENAEWSDSRALSSFLKAVPCVVVSGCDDTQVIRECFKVGVRDYLVKPLSLNVLLVKLDQLVSESDRNEAEAQMAGVLTARERAILELLFETYESKSAEQMALGSSDRKVSDRLGITKEEILQRVWPNVAVSPGAVDVHLSHMRKKLEGTDWEIRLVSQGCWTINRREP